MKESVYEEEKASSPLIPVSDIDGVGKPHTSRTNGSPVKIGSIALVCGILCFLLWTGGICLFVLSSNRSVEEPPIAHVAIITPASIGGVAPTFTLREYDRNRNFSLANHCGKYVHLNFICNCSTCREFAPYWQQVFKQSTKPIVMVAVSTVVESYISEFRRQTGAHFPMVFDPNYEVAERYNSLHCPRYWLISPEGRLLYTSTSGDKPEAVTASLVALLTR